MFKSVSFENIKYVFFYFCIVISIIFVQFKPAVAQISDSFDTLLNVEVVEVKDQKAFCKNGVVVDFSEIKNQRPVEVRDILRATGVFTSTETFPSLIKADWTRVEKRRDITFLGPIQKVVEKGSNQLEITIFNQPIAINKDVFMAANLKQGTIVFITIENTPQGFKTILVDNFSVGKLVTFGGRITAISGNTVTLEGGFTSTLSQQAVDFLKIVNSFTIGAKINGVLEKAPKKNKVLKFMGEGSKFPGPIPEIITSSLRGRIQEIDIVNSTITVFNQKLKVPFSTPIISGTKNIILEDIDLNSIEGAFIDLGQFGIGNSDLLDYSIVRNINIINK